MTIQEAINALEKLKERVGGDKEFSIITADYFEGDVYDISGEDIENAEFNEYRGKTGAYHAQ